MQYYLYITHIRLIFIIINDIYYVVKPSNILILLIYEVNIYDIKFDEIDN